MGQPPGSSGDPSSRLPVRFWPRLLPEDRGLSGSHDSPEPPGIGSIKRPVLAPELPGLCFGVLG
jgi:hypothetical protein